MHARLLRCVLARVGQAQVGRASQVRQHVVRLVHQPRRWLVQALAQLMHCVRYIGTCGCGSVHEASDARLHRLDELGMHALALRQSWDKVKQLEKEGRVAQVKVTGFNRGGVTCDLEGLRGFIPRSQLQDGENHEALVGKTLGVAFLEVNSETRKLVLSEKRAATAARFSELEIGQLVEGHVAAIKPYGLFVDLGGISGLLHQSAITGGSMRSMREIFDQGDAVKALITELDPGRGRIALNTLLLEGQPGELLVEKDKVMAEATDRANRARNVLKQQEQSAG